MARRAFTSREESMRKPVIRIAPNNQVFDLPVIVAIEERLFLDDNFAQTVKDAEEDLIDECARDLLPQGDSEAFYRHFLTIPRRRGVSFSGLDPGHTRHDACACCWWKTTA